MKKLLTLFVLVLATSFVTAQELTPDMLVGEYEGKGIYVNDDSDNEHIDKKATLKIYLDNDTLRFNFKVLEIDVLANLNIVNNGLKIYYDKKEDIGGGIYKITKVENYNGDKITSTEFGVLDEQLRISFVRELSITGAINEESYRYFYLEMKKK